MSEAIFWNRCVRHTPLLTLSPSERLIVGTRQEHILEALSVNYVQTEEGAVLGKVMHSRNGQEYVAFRGLHYAEKPERFKLAPKLQKWEGVRNATEEGKPCPQMYPGSGAILGVLGEEDCLILNVYIHAKKANKALPVMVWIHGGSFVMGSTREYHADYFMDEEIILVAMNYRLGALGFLYNEDDTIPGNLALKDQVEALKWVQRNIHHFGGDPNDVTLFGQSAGGACVHFHILSEMSRGLFHKAIIQSGSALAPWALDAKPKLYAEHFATALNCPPTPPSKMLECLLTHDIDDLVSEGLSEAWGPIWAYHWAPVVEVNQGVNASTAFITKPPEEIIADKVPNPVPLMTGITKNEGAMVFSAAILKDDELLEEMNANWTNICPILALYPGKMRLSSKYHPLSEKIRQYYIGDHPFDLKVEQGLTDFFSDRYFIQPAYASILHHSEVAPTYAYLFTFNDGFSFPHMFNYHHHNPPTHGDDLFLLFNTIIRPHLTTEKEKTFSRNLVKLWTTFAATGKPGSLWGDAKLWPPVNKADSPFMWYRLDLETQLMENPFQARIQFWDQIMANEFKSLDSR